MNVSLFLIVSLCLVGIVFSYPYLKRSWVLKKKFPQKWLNIIQSYLPFYENMSVQEQQQLIRSIQIFLSEKKFFGCAGQTITDEVKIVIASQACLLLLNRKTRIYPKLKFILVYPSSFFTQHDSLESENISTTHNRHVLGESWDNGKIVISWDDSTKGVKDFRDGQNVVLHEFSHQLDSESGATNGAPILASNQYRGWAQVLTQEFERLNRSVDKGKKTFLDSYGATNPAEFFAVATEHFFEQPYKMHASHPELFEQFKAFYNLDTRKWFDE